jgi:hypothetical protein
VAAQLGLWEEPLLHQLDKASFGLGLRLMSECNAGFAKSDAAAACPRLKRRKGTVPPVLPLPFTAFHQQSYAVSEDGALLTSTAAADYRPALCGQRAMNSGQSCAEVTVVRMAGYMMIGVGRPTLDPSDEDAWRAAGFWGLTSYSGSLFHHNSTGSGNHWQGRQSYDTGDVLRLLLDSDAGTLTVKKNGVLLGMAVSSGLTGDLCWAVSCIIDYAEYAQECSVRIKALDPAEF